MNYELAKNYLLEGAAMSRASWRNGVYVFLIPGNTIVVNRYPLNDVFSEGTELQYRSHIDMLYPDGTIGPWYPSSDDETAKDWVKSKPQPQSIDAF